MAHLHHLGYTLPTTPPLRPVRYVILCGSATRAEAIAAAFAPGSRNLCLTDRYTLRQPLPEVLVASHGIGTGSIDPLLHELHRLLHAARAEGYRLVRVGTCGGLGLAPGTLVVTRQPLSGALRPLQTLRVLGRELALPARLDEELSTALLRTAAKIPRECVLADTISAETFHVAQARCDGAFALCGKDERDAFFGRCRDMGVGNIEMESLALAAFATKMRLPAAVICVVLVDRLVQESPAEPKDVLDGYVRKAVDTVVEYVKEQIRK